jgi:hypothetical protein
VRLDFAIADWAAWAPGFTTQDAWRTWAASPPLAPRGPEMPALTEVPALARRRVERMGRLAFQVAAWCQGEARGAPLVFASRHGDAGRSVELLSMLARGEALSPTSFALAVHNATGAQYSIFRADRTNVSAVASGRFTLEAGVVEAVALLAEAPQVLLVMYDVSAPPLYARFFDEPDADFAFAWKLERGGAFSLRTCQARPEVASVLPHALQVLRFVLGTEPSFTGGDGRAGWCWDRHG